MICMGSQLLTSGMVGSCGYSSQLGGSSPVCGCSCAGSSGRKRVVCESRPFASFFDFPTPKPNARITIFYSAIVS